MTDPYNLPALEELMESFAQTFQNIPLDCLHDAPLAETTRKDVINAFIHTLSSLSDQKEVNFRPESITTLLGDYFNNETMVLYRLGQTPEESEVVAQSGSITGNHPTGKLVYSIYKKVCSQGKPKLICHDDTNLSTGDRNLLDDFSANSIFLVPNSASERTLLLLVARKSNESFKLVTLSLGTILFNLSITKYALHDTKQRSQKHIRELEGVQQIALKINSVHGLDKVFKLILKSTLDILPNANNAHIFLYKDHNLVFQDAQWAKGKKGHPIKKPRQNGLTALSARRGEIIVVNDTDTHPVFKDDPYGFDGSLVAMPFIYQKRVVGVMTVAYQEKHAIMKDTLRLLNLFADQAAVAIENARMQSMLHEKAHSDRLTGLPNRRALEKKFTKELNRAKRYNRKLSILFLDLDNFKEINDWYGHQAGDAILKKIAVNLQRMTRNPDFISRFGGDEFVMLLPETCAQEASQGGKRIQALLDELLKSSSKEWEVSLGISYGSATFPKDGQTLIELLNTADQNLYRNK
ncbi:MAG: sensor domain-containing diguanylate cyclase [Anaerolineales bacterium]